VCNPQHPIIKFKLNLTVTGSTNEKAYRIIKLGGLLTFLISFLTIPTVSKELFGSMLNMYHTRCNKITLPYTKESHIKPLLISKEAILLDAVYPRHFRNNTQFHSSFIHHCHQVGQPEHGVDSLCSLM
jgi:hypothetical protein